MKQYGTVVARDGETAKVLVRRHASCERCGACGLGSGHSMEIAARDEVGISVGDSVIIELESSAVFMASAIIYAVPLAFMVIGFLLGPCVSDNLGLGVSSDAVSAVLGLTMLSAAFVGVHIYDRFAAPRRYIPRITAVVGRTNRPDSTR